MRRQFQLQSGAWPNSGEVLVGRLAAAKLGRDERELAIGQTLHFEGRDWTVSGHFAAGGSALESELWCPVEDLQQAMKRQDLSLVAVSVTDEEGMVDLGEFCKERLDLEWQATAETDYYAALQRHYGPVRAVAWLIVLLVAGAGVFAGLNTMYGAVVGRVRELAMLQTLGFSRRAIALSIVQEGTLLAAAGSLLSGGGCLAPRKWRRGAVHDGGLHAPPGQHGPRDWHAHRSGHWNRRIAAARVACPANAGRGGAEGDLKCHWSLVICHLY